KANLLYGLMRTHLLKQIGGAALYSQNLFGVDCLLVFRLAGLGQLGVAEDVLFHKRLPPGGRTGVPWWLSRVPSLVPTQYLEDYERVLVCVPMSRVERAVLSTLVRVRMEQNRSLQLGARFYRLTRNHHAAPK